VAEAPGFEEAYNHYQTAARLYLQNQDDQAFRILSNAEAHDPALGCVANLKGGIYLRRGDAKRAIENFQKAIELLPDSSVAFVNLASVYQLEGQSEQARANIQRALAISAINGDQAALQTRLESLYRLWDQHKTIIFMDPF
jgi:tetratricopeptide (TPR) repeat protein